MKKILPIIIVSILVIGGLRAFAFDTDDSKETQQMIEVDKSLTAFSQVIIEEVDTENIELHFNDGSASFIMNPGQPKLPKIIKHVELPFTAQNIEVEVTAKNLKEYYTEKEIAPALPLVPLTNENYNSDIFTKDMTIYESDNPFPSTWYKYEVRSGLNDNNLIVKHVFIQGFPVRYTPATGKIIHAEEIDITIKYDQIKNDLPIISQDVKYDLVIIAPSKFSNELQKLVNHKNDMGIKTRLKTTEDIYKEYNGRDEPEKIKYFIKDEIETREISYVLLVGGLKSLIWAKPRDTHNYGAKHWYVPVRYTNLYDRPKHPLESEEAILHDPGVISDLYYADIYDGEGDFSSWDTNNDGVFAAWECPFAENDTDIDSCPDVNLGRLACRSILEVKTVVNKIINYETTAYGQEWFKKMMVFSGDGFLDQEDIDIQWNTTNLPDGKYTIYAQSRNSTTHITGKTDYVEVTINHCAESSIKFKHDDHLQIDHFPNYPYDPIAEIVSPSCGDVLGKTDVDYAPEKNAYDNEFSGWANVTYVDGIMHIRGKSYDPQPYGVKTDIHVSIKNEEDEVVFSEWKNGLEMYYEGEWVTGEQLLKGRGGALYYMPNDFEKDIYWASNGRLTGQRDVIKAISQGAGFVFFSGHGSPNVWADHFPGIPGDRAKGSLNGLQVTSLPFVTLPVSPMRKLRNGDMLPVIMIGGCHNSQFNVSIIPALLDIFNKRYMWTHCQPVPECFSWRLISVPQGGAIATVGNTGLGYGRIGEECTTGGGDGWISLEFFKQYGEGHEILGDAYTQAIVNYVNTFDLDDLEEGHLKTIQQWVLLGDPSLMLGGYE